MTLLDRVTTLVRANLNELIEQAEDPEKLLKQLLLDIQNQYVQLKTQVAVGIAGQHQLEKKQRDSEAAQAEWMQKAELAVAQKKEELARVAIERALGCEAAAKNFAGQLKEQSEHVELLREALGRLESKLAETKARVETLLAQHRRARNAQQAGKNGGSSIEQDAAMERARGKISRAEAEGDGFLGAMGELDAEERLEKMEKTHRVEQLLEELKRRTARV